MEIDNITLDESNVEFNYAADFVKHTNRLVYLTGKAGTGKTTFLKYLHKTVKKNMVIVAPTGVAAINAGGQTIHSFFQIKPSVYYPGDKRLRIYPQIFDQDQSTIFDHFKFFKEKIDMLRAMQLLIIDEISMVRCDLLDVIDSIMRAYRRREMEPFGGVQVILIGDTFQLPPIADAEQWEILGQFYESPFFFSAQALKNNKPIYIELKKIYRQNEPEFIQLLNSVRVNQVSQHELSIINSKYDPTFTAPENSNYIVLATHNKIVDSTNLTKLAELPGEVQLFEATITGTFPDNTYPTDKVLQLKEGAQVMFIKNDKQKRFYNGKICKITIIKDAKITVELTDKKGKTDQIVLDQEEWENIRYTWNDAEKKIKEETIGTFTQYPIKLAWAVTVHKSQGLTFEHVIADLGGAFSPGQVYVALSRCTTFSGLVLKSRIERSAIITNNDVMKFAQNETPSTLIVQELNTSKADYFYSQARQAVRRNDYQAVLENYYNAIIYRNDTDTDEFKRYVKFIMHRLGKNRKRARKMVEDLKQLADENKILKEKNTQLEAKQHEHNIAKERLLNRVKELEKSAGRKKK